MIQKVVPYWQEQEIQVRLVVERHEYGAYNGLKNRMKWGKGVYLLPLPLAGRGIGYSRRYCVMHARRTGLESIIIADDDHKPARDSDMHLLLEEAAKPGVLGVGGVRPLNDRNTGGFLSKNSGVILCPGGWGFTIFGLNVNTAINLGNYDASLHTMGEDSEIARQGIAHKIPWRVHCDVWFTSLNKRGDPGGFATRWRTQEARKAAERECMAIIHKRWPDYTNHPDKPLRMAWQRMLDDYIPNWRDMSALHGGSLNGE